MAPVASLLPPFTFLPLLPLDGDSKKMLPGTSSSPTSTATAPAPSQTNFLSLPTELRLQIYRHLLVLPRHTVFWPSPSPSTAKNLPANDSCKLHPAILLTNRLIHAEASQVLYAENIFLATEPRSPVLLLAAAPRLRAWYPPITTATGSQHQSLAITRWALPLRLLAAPPSAPESTALAKTLSHAREILLAVPEHPGLWLGLCPGVGALRPLESVRGVRVVRVAAGSGGGSVGLEGYLAWLAGAMRQDEGSEVEGYTTPDGAERKRLSGFEGGEEEARYLPKVMSGGDEKEVLETMREEEEAAAAAAAVKPTPVLTGLSFRDLFPAAVRVGGEGIGMNKMPRIMGSFMGVVCGGEVGGNGGVAGVLV